MNYLDMVRRALFLWWKTKLLWPLGILAALFGYSEYSTGNVNVNLPIDENTPIDPRAAEFFENLAENNFLESFLANPGLYILGLVLLLVVWSTIGALIGLLAHGAMIRMADVADQGYAANLPDGLRVGAARVLPLFLLNLLLALPSLLLAGGVLIFVLSAVVPLLRELGVGVEPDPETILPSLLGGLFCLIPLVLLGLLVNLVLSLFARIAQRCCVLEARGPIQSLNRSWQLVRANFGLTLLNWVVLVVITALFGVLATLPIIAILLPAMLNFFTSGTSPVGALIGALIYGLIVSVIIGGVLTSFNSTLWTVLYRVCVSRERAAVAPIYPAQPA